MFLKKILPSNSQNSIGTAIISSGLLVTSVLFMGRFFAILKELYVAHKFGVSESLETYCIALIIPLYFINVLTNSISPVFMSKLIDIREKIGEKESHQFYTKFLSFLILGLSILVILLYFLGEHFISFIAAGFSEEKLFLTLCLFYWIVLSIPLKILSSTFTNFLDSKKMFFVSGLAPLWTSLLTVFALIFLFNKLEIYSLIIGFVGGALIEGLWLFYFAKRAGFKLLKFSKEKSSSKNEMAKQYGATLIGIIFIFSFPIIDNSFAARLSPGSVLYLSYGEKLTSFLLLFLLSIFGTAVLPYVSMAIAKKNKSELFEITKFYFLAIFFGLLPVAALLSYFSSYIVDIFYFSSSFTPEDRELITSVQSILLLQMPFYASILLLTRIIIAMGKNYVLLMVNLGSFFFKIFSAYFLCYFYGFLGIPTSTPLTLSFMTLILGIICIYVMKNENRTSPISIESNGKDPAYSH